MTRTARVNKQPPEQQQHKHACGLSLAVASALVLVGLIATSRQYDANEQYNLWNSLSTSKSTTTMTTTTTTTATTGRSLYFDFEGYHPALEEEEEQYKEKEEVAGDITTGTVTAITITSNDEVDGDDESLLLKMVERLSPKTFTTRPVSPTDAIAKEGTPRGAGTPGTIATIPVPTTTSNNLTTTTSTNLTILSRHQFLHLHHMKTAGTSMDEVINCGIDRMKDMHVDWTVPYANVHECSLSTYRDCLQGSSGFGKTCQQKVVDSAILSYCAPLHDLDIFGWTTKDNSTSTAMTMTQQEQETQQEPSKQVTVLRDNDFHALTVLRDPVARVWSMYRFKTKACYDCVPLLDVYAAIDAGTSKILPMCADQLQNHMSANLLSTNRKTTTNTTTNNNDTDDESEEKVQEAIYNMQHFFTMIGLTEQLDETMELLGYTFPWLQETIPGSAKKCSLPHANSSPRNNPCPSAADSEPDEATRKAIEAHNRLDMQVYEAAVKHFDLQVKALRYIQNQKP